MVVTVVLSGIPRYVTLLDLARNLDNLFDESNLGGFDARNLPPHPKTKKRRVALDFSSGYDAISAQEVLNNYHYELTNGTNHTLRAKITRDPDLIRATGNMTNSERNPDLETALVLYSNQRNTYRKNNEDSDSLEEQYISLKRELRKLEKKKKLAKLKKKITKLKNNVESRSNTSSSSVSPQLSRKAIKSKKGSRSSSRRSRSIRRETSKRSRNRSRDSRSSSTEIFRKVKKSKPDDSLDHKKTSQEYKKYRRGRSNEQRSMSPASNHSNYRRYLDEELSLNTGRSPNHSRSPNTRWAPEYRRLPNVRRSLYDRRSPELRRLQTPERRSPSNRRPDSSKQRKSLDYTYRYSGNYSASKGVPNRYTNPRRSRSSTRSNYGPGAHKSEVIYVDRPRDVAQMRWEQPSTSKDDYYRTQNDGNRDDQHPAHVTDLDDNSHIINPETSDNRMWSSLNPAIDNFPKSDDDEKSDSSSTTQKINIVISVTKNKSTSQVETQNSKGVMHKPIKEKKDYSKLKINTESDMAEHIHAPKDKVTKDEYYVQTYPQNEIVGDKYDPKLKIKSENNTKEISRTKKDNAKTNKVQMSAQNDRSDSAVQIKTEQEIIDLSNEIDENASNVVQTCTQNDTMDSYGNSVIVTENSTRVLNNTEEESNESNIDDAINELANLVEIEMPTNKDKKNYMSNRKIDTNVNKEVPVTIKKEKNDDDLSMSNYFEKSNEKKSKRKDATKIKRICENPKFVLSIHVIMRKMLRHVSHLKLDTDVENKYVAVTTLALRYRIRVLLKHCKEYLDKNQIVKLYRENYPEEEDKELAETIIADIQSGKYADLDLQPQEKKKKKKVRDTIENTDPNLKEMGEAINDSNTNGKYINRNVEEPNVNNSKPQLKPTLADNTNHQNKESTLNSSDKVNLNIKLEKDDVSDIPKTTHTIKSEILQKSKNKSSNSRKASHIDIKQVSSKSKSTPSSDKVEKDTVVENTDKNQEKSKSHKKPENMKNKMQDKEHKRHKTNQNAKSTSKFKKSESSTIKKAKIDLPDESSQLKKLEGDTINSKNIDDDVVIIDNQVPIIDLSDNNSLYENNKEEKSIEPPIVLTSMVEKVFKKDKGVPDNVTDSEQQAAESFKNPKVKKEPDSVSKYEINLKNTEREPKNKRGKKRSEKIETKETNQKSPKTNTIINNTYKVENEPEESNQNIENFLSLITTITQID